MKQRIIVEQLNELSNKGKEKLLKWQQSKLYDNFDDIDATSTLYMCSIGQMIEFLDEFCKKVGARKMACYADYDKEHMWSIYESWHTYHNRDSVKYDKKELCDALWEAVKSILEWDPKDKKS